MRNFQPSRKRQRALLTPGVTLAFGPWLLALGCAIYDDALLDPATVAGSSGGASIAGSENIAEGGSGPEPVAGKAATAGAGATPSAGATAGGGGGAGGGGVAGAGVGGSGGAPSAGSAGTGAAGTPPIGDADALDTMEDEDAQIEVAGGRNGYWYVGNDGTVAGTQEPSANAFAMAELGADARVNSSFAAHMKVAGFTGWGTVIGLNLVEQLALVKPYDASAYCGVRFWAKAAAVTTLLFRVPDSDTHPLGGVCVDGGPAGQACYDHFGSSAALTTAWKQFTAMFAELQQAGTGYHPADMKLNADKLYGLEWALPGSGGKAYEIWIDDVELLTCQ